MATKKITLEKQSALMRKRWATPEWRERRIAALRKRFEDPESKIKATAHHCKRSADPTYRAKQAAITRHWWADPSNRAKRTLAAQIRSANPEWRKMMSAAVRKQWKDPVYRTKMEAAIRLLSKSPAWREQNKQIVRRAQEAARRARPSSIEQIVWSVLDKLQIQYIREHRIGRYLADIYVPSKSLVIECDGRHWHAGRVAEDAKRDAYMHARGYNVLRLPEQDIRKGFAEERIKRVVSQRR